MILGREPALWAAGVRAAIALISALFISLTTDQQGALNAVVACILGIIVAIQVKSDKAVPFILGLVEAVVYLAVSFGWHITPDKQTLIVGFVAAIVAIWTRDRVIAPVDEVGARR
jgi:nicotinamide riboside transporter PnuC